MIRRNYKQKRRRAYAIRAHLCRGRAALWPYRNTLARLDALEHGALRRAVLSRDVPDLRSAAVPCEKVRAELRRDMHGGVLYRLPCEPAPRLERVGLLRRGAEPPRSDMPALCAAVAAAVRTRTLAVQPHQKNIISVVFVRCAGLVLKLHCELYYAARPEALRAELDEVLRVLEGGDAAGRLDLDGSRAVLAHELHVLARRAWKSRWRS